VGIISVSSIVHVRIQGLDLLRGLAILLVLIRHSWPDAAGNAGIVGVVAFFTLSGYLITGLLVSDLQRFGRIRYNRFYRNRAIRLIPALVFLLVGFVVAEGVLNVSGTRGQVLNSLVVAITYTMNLPGFPHGSPNLSHLWTLANEEQFYLVWPVILLLGVRFRKLRWVVLLCGVGIMLSLVASILVAAPDVYKVYTLPTAWTVSMVIGAAAQLGREQIGAILHGRRATAVAALAGLSLMAIAVTPQGKNDPLTYLVGGPLMALLTVAVLWGLREWQVVPMPLRPLLGLGTISYAAYLWNYPLGWWLQDVGVMGWQYWAIAGTIAIASLSWYAIERPCSRIRNRLDAKSRVQNHPAETPLSMGSPPPTRSSAG
jgi:peptidoglycan/LPS O-acetylase OafA/YrhL